MTTTLDPPPVISGRGVPAARDRCPGRGCEHARSRHDPTTGGCLVCDRCRGWAESRPHWWREYVTTTYRHAREQWEIHFNLDTSTTWEPGLIARERRRERRGGRREVTDFLEQYPVPTFRAHLEHQAGTHAEEAS